MDKIELLILHGPPGSGKTSLAQTASELLRQQDITHAVLDLDYLAKIYPRKHLDIMYKNLAAVWPNYQAIGEIKIIIPTYLQEGEFEIVTAAAPAYKTQVCEIIAPVEVLEERIKAREKRAFQVALHLDYLHQYATNGPSKEQIDFQVVNHGKPKEESAREVLERAGWI